MFSIIVPLYVDQYTDQIDLTLTYYNNLSALHEVIVIDDCSPISIPYKKFAGIRFARITTDIKWNQPGARNLGASLAKSDKFIFVDIDHLLPPSFSIFKDGITFFKRLYKGEEIKPSQGIVGINRKDFKGYDEDFCGSYGKDDKFFIFSHEGRIRTTNDYVVCLNSNTHSLLRDKTTNELLFKQKFTSLQQGVYEPTKQLRFEWETTQ